MADKVVLAYSGGLDTSAALRWIDSKHTMEVIALTVDIGGVGNRPVIWQETLKIGAVKALRLEARRMFGLCERLAQAALARCSIDFRAK